MDIYIKKVLSLFFALALMLAAGCSTSAQVPAQTNSPHILAPETPTPAGSVASRAGSTLTVLAAASLTDAFKEIGRDFQSIHAGTGVAFSFAGSQQLRSQLEQGAQADVFASADIKNMDALKSANLLVGDSQVFAHNMLIVIIPKTNPKGLASLKDLANPGVKIVLADQSVPAGSYTLQIVDKLSAGPTYGSDFKAKVLANVVSKETDVKAVVSKISLGEGDAGIVYTTDATAAADKLSTIAIPGKFNVLATYPIAVLKVSANPVLAKQFVDYVLSGGGQATITKYGFASR